MRFESKSDAIVYCSEKLGLQDIFKRNNFKISYNDFICTISLDKYNLTDLNISASTVARYHKILFPDRESNVKACTYILSLFNCKYCSKCGVVYETDNFFKNASRNRGTSSYCKACDKDCWGIWYSENKNTHIERVAEYRSRLKLAMPAWADTDKISDIYNSRKDHEHVDHIIPLKNDIVCGLHVHNNLICISKKENLEKNNKFNPDDFYIGN